MIYEHVAQNSVRCCGLPSCSKHFKFGTFSLRILNIADYLANMLARLRDYSRFFCRETPLNTLLLVPNDAAIVDCCEAV